MKSFFQKLPNGKAIRQPVDYRYDAINPEFLKFMARIGAYAAGKYGAWEQYTAERLTGEKSPINHIYEHVRSFVQGEPHDRFGADPRWHLAAIAYNAMMEFYYVTRWGHTAHPLRVRTEAEKLDPPWDPGAPDLQSFFKP